MNPGGNKLKVVFKKQKVSNWPSWETAEFCWISLFLGYGLSQFFLKSHTVEALRCLAS